METRLPFACLLLGALHLPAPAHAAEAPAAVSAAEASSPGRTRLFARLSYLTSMAGGTDYRSFRSSSADETGGLSDSATMPGLHYVSARLGAQLWRDHLLSFSTLQNLDSAERRKEIVGRGGRGSRLGRQTFSARYGYSLSRAFSLSAGQSLQGEKFSDPSLGLAYRNRGDGSFGHRLGLTLSAPLSERSRKQRLITRATARASATLELAGPWQASAGVSYSRPFHERAHELPPMRGRDDDDELSSGLVANAEPTELASRPRRGRGNRGVGGGEAAGTGSAPSAPQEADLVLREREVDRTTASVGLGFRPTDRWKLATGAGVTYVQTARQKAVWMTSARVLAASYTYGKMEAGADLKLFSDVRKYRHVSLPSLWSAGVQLSFLFGDGRDGG